MTKEEAREKKNAYMRKWYAERKAKKRLENAEQTPGEPKEAPEKKPDGNADSAIEFEVAMAIGEKRYILECGADGCEGCIFSTKLPSFQLCAALSADEFEKANTLCRELGGQWKEAGE